MKTKYMSRGILNLLLLLGSAASFQPQIPSSRNPSRTLVIGDDSRQRHTIVYAARGPEGDLLQTPTRLTTGQREQRSSLRAVSIATDESQIETRSLPPMQDVAYSNNQAVKFPSIPDDIKAIVSTALLITGNTVGAGTLVLPEVASRPGLAATTAIFGSAYLINLISGLVVAEVAIKQHESSGNSVPSSLKEFAEGSLDSPKAGTAVSAISLFTNCCLLSFGLVRAGSVMSALLGGSHDVMEFAGLYALGLAALVTVFTSEQLAYVASAMVATLFASFAGLLIPGLASIHDPVAAFFTPATSNDMVSALAEAAPIMLTTTLFQNIVPSVTKILNYDRFKTTVAIALGSLLPILMYLAWCFACIGGNVDPTAGIGGPIVNVFSVAAISGSCLGCTMSLSEEVDTHLQGDREEKAPTFSVPAALAAVGVPLTAAFVFSGGEDFSTALKMAGSYGSPTLYGVIPVLMAWTQRNKLPDAKDMLPGGVLNLAALGLCFGGLIAAELTHDFLHLLGQ